MKVLRVLCPNLTDAIRLWTQDLWNELDINSIFGFLNPKTKDEAEEYNENQFTDV